MNPLKRLWPRPLLAAVLAMVLTVGLAGCAAVDSSAYVNEKPALDLKTYFNGRVMAWGMFQDRSGKVVKRFNVTMNCSWTVKDGVETGVLEEDFVYSDGTRQRRVWTLRRTASDRYVGTADDVVGEAIGIVAGNTLRWKYVLSMDIDGRNYHLDFDDWMILMDDKVMLNRAVMSKFGVTLGEVTLTFVKS